MGEMVLQYVQKYEHKWKCYLPIMGELSFDHQMRYLYQPLMD
jgi:hypothetical protein